MVFADPLGTFGARDRDVVDWVEGGGGLWLVADHHPFPGAAAALAGRFGFELHNGFALREPEPGVIDSELIGFRRADQTIVTGHPITDGARPEQRLEQLLSFTGEAFELPSDARALFVMPADGVMLLPEVAWEFTEETPREAAGGWAVAAAREHGRGKVAMCGEAACCRRVTSMIMDKGSESEWCTRAPGTICSWCSTRRAGSRVD